MVKSNKEKLLRHLNNNAGTRFVDGDMQSLYPWKKRLAERKQEWRDIETKQVLMIRINKKKVDDYKIHPALQVKIAHHWKTEEAKKLFRNLQ